MMKGTNTDTANLTNQLLAIAKQEGALLAPGGSELLGRIESIGTVLNDAGGLALMLQVHTVIKQNLGPDRARELEAAWDGIGDWLG